MDTNFGRNVFNRMLLNATKFQDYSSYRLLVIMGKQMGVEGGRNYHPPTQITRRLHRDFYSKEVLGIILNVLHFQITDIATKIILSLKG